MSSPNKRSDLDLRNLMMNNYNVEPIEDRRNEFDVEFHGPKESLYEGGVWKVRVMLPDDYPYRRPYIRFVNRIFHPNIDEISGSICVDVLKETWTPVTDLVHVFEFYLPQLLLYPNPLSPLNTEAASLMIEDNKQYEQKVKEYCELFAKDENKSTPGLKSDEEDISDGKCTSSEDDTPGHADPEGHSGGNPSVQVG